MVAKILFNHSRGLCGKPDIPNNTSFEIARANPPHCQCCGATMRVIDSLSLSFQQLGMYEVVCPTC